MGTHFRRNAAAVLAAGLLFAGCDDHSLFGPDPQFRATAGASLNAVATAWNRTDLTWIDNVTNETSWEIERSAQGPGGPFALWGSNGASVTTFSDGAVQGNAQFCYRVRSARIQGRRITYGAFSNTACVTTPAVPPHSPPTGVSAFPYNGSAIVVIWIDNSAYETGFRVERAGAASGPWTALTTVSNHTGYFDTAFGGVEVLRCYRVVAFGNGSETTSASDCTGMPAAPSNFAAVLSHDGVHLTWVDNSAVEDGFVVTKITDGWSNYREVGRLGPNSLSYRDTTTMYGGWALYFVQATRDSGTSAQSNQGFVSVEPPPQPPFTYSPIPLSSSVMSVSWQDMSENTAGFLVERSLDDGLTWFPIASVANQSWHVFNDSGLVSDRRVCYQITAYNNGGTASALAGCATPPAAPTGFTVTAVDATTLQFSWTDNSSVEEGYQIVYEECFAGECYWVGLLTAGPNSTSVAWNQGGMWGRRLGVHAIKDGGTSDLVTAYSPPQP